MFDPYHKWLGIPPEQRPPTHYQLLGIAAGEKDLEVIEEAALRQTAHIRAYQVGPHAQDCTRILNELAQAKTVLLNPAKRKEYDARLAQIQAQKQVPKQVETAPPTNAAAAEWEAVTKTPPPPRPARDKRSRGDRKGERSVAKEGVFLTVPMLLGIGGGVVVTLLLVVVGLLFALRPGPAPVPPMPPAPPVAQVKPKVVDPVDPVKPPEVVVKPKDPIKDADIKVIPKPPPPPPIPVNNDKIAAEIVFPAPAQKFPPTMTASPDGDKVVHYGARGGPEMLDIATRELSTLPVGNGHLYRFSPDGTLFASASGSTLLVCSLDGKRKLTLRGRTHLSDVAFSPDGKTIVAAAEGKVRIEDKRAVMDAANNPIYDDTAVHIWDAVTGEERGVGVSHTNRIMAVGFSPDGEALSWGTDGLRRWDLTGRAVGHTPTHLLFVRISGDGKSLLGMDRATGKLVCFDIAQEKIVRRVPTVLPVSAVAVSHDGHYALLSVRLNKGGKEIVDDVTLWDTVAGLAVRQADAFCPQLSLSRDGTVATFGDMDGRVWRWDTKVAKVDPKILPKGQLKIDPAKIGNVVKFGRPEKKADDPPYAAELFFRSPHKNTVIIAAVMPDDRLLTQHLGGFVMMDPKTYEGPSVAAPPGATRLAVSGDGNVFAIGRHSDASFVTIDNQKLGAVKFNSMLSSIALSEDGRLCVTGTHGVRQKDVVSAPSFVQLWDVPTGELLWTSEPHGYPIDSVAFTPGGGVVSNSHDTMRRWDPKTGQPTGKFVHKLAAARVSGDGKHLFGGETTTGPFVLYTAQDEKLVRRVPIADQFFQDMCLSRDGRYFLVASRGRAERGMAESVSYWDTVAGKQIGRVPLECYNLAVSSDGAFAYFSDNDGRIWRWTK